METIELEIEKKGLTTTSFDDLYKNAFQAVAHFVSKMNGSFEDAKDIFHDALVIFREKTEDESFILFTSAEAYVIGIAKHLWIKRSKNNKRNVSLDDYGSLHCYPRGLLPNY